MSWRLRFISSLPQTWQDGVIRKIMNRVRVKK
jgi:hypothetical protein